VNKFNFFLKKKIRDFLFFKGKNGFLLVFFEGSWAEVGLSKPIRRLDPQKKPIRSNPMSAYSTTPAVGGGPSPPENRSWRVSFGFPPPKSEKPKPTEKSPDSGEKPIFRRKKFPDPSKKTQILTRY